MKLFQLLVLSGCLALTARAGETRGTEPDLRPDRTPTNVTSYVEQLKVLLDKITSESRSASDKGRQVAEETGKWFKTDFQKIGDWEYKQLTLSRSELPDIEKRLNELGADRWNCFWIAENGESLHLLFKRPAVSYLHKLSQIDFMQLLSVGSRPTGE